MTRLVTSVIVRQAARLRLLPRQNRGAQRGERLHRRTPWWVRRRIPPVLRNRRTIPPAAYARRAWTYLRRGFAAWAAAGSLSPRNAVPRAPPTWAGLASRGAPREIHRYLFPQPRYRRHCGGERSIGKPRLPRAALRRRAGTPVRPA